MAADILLYQTDFVPVGDDQKQHMEITRDIAERFNGIYGNVFTVPQPLLQNVGSRIMSLADPLRKMDKSDENENAYIGLLDEPEVIVKKFKRAVTDSGSGIYASPEKPGITNLMTIYAQAADCTLEEVRGRFEGKGYGDFKKAVGETVAEVLRPIREEALRISADRGQLLRILGAGAEKAAAMAAPTLRDVYDNAGFVRRGD
jgi:tryptophanyl-tRNA synthetase